MNLERTLKLILICAMLLVNGSSVVAAPDLTVTYPVGSGSGQLGGVGQEDWTSSVESMAAWATGAAVLDVSNDRIVLFDEKGAWKKAVSLPRGFYFDLVAEADGTLITADSEARKVQSVSETGVRELFPIPSDGGSPFLAHYLVKAGENLAILDYQTGLHVISPSGKPLAVIGTCGYPPSFASDGRFGFAEGNKLIFIDSKGVSTETNFKGMQAKQSVLIGFLADGRAVIWAETKEDAQESVLAVVAASGDVTILDTLQGPFASVMRRGAVFGNSVWVNTTRPASMSVAIARYDVK